MRRSRRICAASSTCRSSTPNRCSTRTALALFTALGDENYLKYAVAHRDVILRFGRFPHRNRALGRDSTPEEQAWLDAGGGF